MDRPPPVHYAQTTDGVAIAYSDFGQGPTLIEVPQGGWTHLVLWEVPRIRQFYELLVQGQANMPVEGVDKQIAALLPLKNDEPLARLFAAQHAVDARDAAQRCSVPARVIRHGAARSPGREFVLEVAQLPPNAEFIEIDGPNHYLEYGPLDDTIELITSWLVTLDDTQAPLGAAGGGESNSSAIDTDLTPRETDVLRLLAQGRRTAEIAEALTISPHTVTRHTSYLLRKIGCSNRVEATRWAMDHGLLDDGD